MTDSDVTPHSTEVKAFQRRVDLFNSRELPGQTGDTPMVVHRLVNDLWDRLEALLAEGVKLKDITKAAHKRNNEIQALLAKERKDYNSHQVEHLKKQIEALEGELTRALEFPNLSRIGSAIGCADEGGE